MFFFAALGLYTFMFTGVRQCLAMCICLLSYEFIKGRRLVPFLLCVALAYTFHKSSILFLAAYFVYPRKLHIGNIVLYAALAGIFMLNIELIQAWFNEQLDYDYGIERTGSGLIYLLVVGSITVFSAFMMKLYHRESHAYLGAFNISVIALVFWILRLATRTAERPSYYFLFFTMASLAYGVDAIKNRREKLVVGFLVICVSVLLFAYRFLTNFRSMVPYVPAF